MIGNDVIDILQSRKESNWKRRGFIEKIYTLDEQLLIANATDPEIMVWILWSMKEAAYKIYNRQTNIREFSPRKLVCTITSQNKNRITGNVICSGNKYYTQTILSPEKIHSIAVSSFDDLNKVVEIENKSISKDKNGIPNLIVTSNSIQDVSISHHGRFEKVVTLSQP
ncbi:4'-phosphopantetheinyl transferase superfamily protein [Flavobacterium sp. 1355]|uniref:4'-phosphopantetheinyl transferase family protein n=1 Tax=Flavobacterium sp. 1355 TaxID=2806571 RepID=UPI001AEA2CD1|nr:4'-phosphopantetheinyl transferase superfamily protein [Flavobacterium sp. 1355]MBP1222376.1 phosphopantetheinyl transferase (holo-ACP synthase) [Flavobacterium sp. 1355]